MSTLMTESNILRAVKLWFTEEKIYVLLSDDREIAVPLKWFPHLFTATEKQRNNWRLIGKGIGIHWEDIDEDLSAQGLLNNLLEQ
ncbi:MAG: DUF2442 domain-containing protein [Saprospiraceae bacterium]|nr:DUF2442 domain-containing protein [Saprospiraceae bacterium]